MVREGVITHYLPLGPEGEKGIDVWLALEAYELAIYKRFDVSVLIACDGDFLPLVRKLNTIGTRVMLLAWDFKWTDQNDQERETRTAQVLLDEVSYPVMMHQIIDDRSKRSDKLVSNLFVPHKELKATLPVAAMSPPPMPAATAAEAGAKEGSIKLLKDGYGFINPADGGPNMFFFHSEVQNADFNELTPGQKVRYRLGTNTKGPCAVQVEVVGASEAN